MREVSKTNRILSLVLCVCMVLSMVPGCVLPVQAEGADSVCTCESSDPNGHAPFCDLYIAPENPACYCVAKCNEGNTNEYCDVCYFAPDACAASGEEDAALYASSYNYITSLTVGYSSKSASSAKILFIPIQYSRYIRWVLPLIVVENKYFVFCFRVQCKRKIILSSSGIYRERCTVAFEKEEMCILNKSFRSLPFFKAVSTTDPFSI